jgi:hypothetical protein
VEETQMKKRTQAEQIKFEKQEQLEQAYLQREQEHLKNSSVKQMIKSMELGLQDKKSREQAERKARARQELISKILQENATRLQIESEVVRMEQEELELINRLQNTQMLQRAAYDDLENALSSHDSSQIMRQQQ